MERASALPVPYGAGRCCCSRRVLALVHPVGATCGAHLDLAVTPDFTSGPVDSLEVRWVVPGPLAPEMRSWLARFPVTAEAREDRYLVQPRLPGLSVKLRHRKVLDVKLLLGSQGTIDLPPGGRGSLELWRKWSFPCDLSTAGDDTAAVWAVVGKERISAWLPLDTGDDPSPGDHPAGETGCAVELTEITSGTGQWTSLGFEARGAPALLRDALEHAVGLVFAVAPPAGSGFTEDNSLSFARWLREQRPCGPTPAL